MYSVVYVEFSKVYFEKTLYKSAVLDNCILYLSTCKVKDNLFIKNGSGEVVASADEVEEQPLDFVHKKVA